MKQKQQHIIRQLDLELNLGATGEEDYHALAERLSQLGKQDLPEWVDQVLSRLVPTDTYVRYDRLELELDIHSLDELERVLRSQLIEKLKVALDAEEQTTRSSPTRRVDLGEREAFSFDKGPAEWIYYFLKNGRLPWSAPRDLQLSALSYELTERIAEDRNFAFELVHLMLRRSDALQRMLVHFGGPMILRQVFHLASSETYLQKRNLENRSREIDQKPLSEQKAFWKEELIALSEDIGGVAETEKPCIGAEVQAEDLSKDLKEQKDSVVGQSEMYIRNAGLVLLHPFLPRFLQKQGVVEDHEILDPNVAASLLQSLVSGASPQAEWELVLPKLLLGLPLGQSLSLPTITPEQLTEGTELIQAAIDHWDALGKTTVDGFRQSFLQREGILQAKWPNWYLQVEKAPYDLLLDRLPWNIAMLKLPWMEGMLYVEWN